MVPPTRKVAKKSKRTKPKQHAKAYAKSQARKSCSNCCTRSEHTTCLAWTMGARCYCWAGSFLIQPTLGLAYTSPARLVLTAASLPPYGFPAVGCHCSQSMCTPYPNQRLSVGEAPVHRVRWPCPCVPQVMLTHDEADAHDSMTLEEVGSVSLPRDLGSPTVNHL